MFIVEIEGTEELKEIKREKKSRYILLYFLLFLT